MTKFLSFICSCLAYLATHFYDRFCSFMPQMQYIRQPHCVIVSCSLYVSLKCYPSKASHRNKESCPAAHIWMQNLPSFFQHNKWWVFITVWSSTFFPFYVGRTHFHALTVLLYKSSSFSHKQNVLMM